MKRLHTTSQNATRHGTATGNVGVATIILVIGVGTCGPAGAQSIKFQGLTIEKAKDGFVVKGEVQGSGLNDVGIVESDEVVVVADIKENASATFQLLPESMYIRDPSGAETSYTKGSGPGNTMTRSERDGKDIKPINIAGIQLRNAPVWRAYGGLSDWSKKAPATVTKEFKGNIPLEYAGKTLRIRATLTHRWGGPYANWPAFSFHHDIGYNGILKGGIAPGSIPPGGDVKVSDFVKGPNWDLDEQNAYGVWITIEYIRARAKYYATTNKPMSDLLNL